MELDTAAWDRWVAYRVAIKKALKPASLDAAKVGLMRYGEDQAAVVEQSIANQYTGLFPLKLARISNDANTPKVRTKAQQAADDANWQYMDRQSEKHWSAIAIDPLGKLLMCEALLARYDAEQDQSSIALSEKRSWLKERVADFLRVADAGAVLADLRLIRLVRRLFNEAGIRRLELRTQKEAA